MNGHQAKKIRKMYTDDMRARAKEMAELVGNAMKPKPKFVPMWLWIKGASIFIKINKTGIKK